MDLVLGLVGALCCLVLPALVLSAPLAVVGVRAIRANPARRGRISVGLGLVNALVSGAVLTIAGLFTGMSVASEDAGTILGWLLSVGCVGGLFSGFGVTALLLTVATRTPTAKTPTAPSASGTAAVSSDGDPSPQAAEREARKTRGARRLFVAATVLFIVGTATTLVGTVFAFTIGMISLALAAVSVRPIALAFVAAHGLSLVLSVWRCSGSPERKRAAGAAIAMSALGMLMASLIASFGPSFFHSLVSAAADGLAR